MGEPRSLDPLEGGEQDAIGQGALPTLLGQGLVAVLEDPVGRDWGRTCLVPPGTDRFADQPGSMVQRRRSPGGPLRTDAARGAG